MADSLDLLYLEDVIRLQPVGRWYERRGFATLDRDRLADTTISIYAVWNRFLSDVEP
jgi:hypothetical protein